MFYTYIHRQSGVSRIAGVFYVGKGTRKRAWDTNRRSKLWSERAAEKGFIVEIVEYWAKEKNAFDHEMKLIAQFRALGARLVNLTNGGDGIRLVPELIQKRAATLRATNKLPEVKQRRSETMLLRYKDPEYKAKHTAAMVESAQRVLPKKQEVARRLNKNLEMIARRNASIIMTASKKEYREKKRRISLENGNRPPTYHGGNHPMARKVICEETGELFLTVRAAVDWLKSKGESKASPSAIVAVCRKRGHWRSAYKYHWRYAETVQ
jgi:hypothetical protein